VVYHEHRHIKNPRKPRLQFDRTDGAEMPNIFMRRRFARLVTPFSAVESTIVSALHSRMIARTYLLMSPAATKLAEQHPDVE
jgi:hypothetical protein